MMFSNPVLKYGFLFLIMPILLQFTGFIDISIGSVFSFSSFFIGLLLFYYSYGSHNFAAVFTGSLLFFTGMFLFVISTFLLRITFIMLFTGGIFVLGSSFFMVYLEQTKKRWALYSSAGMVLLGFLLSIAVGNLALKNFLTSVWEVVKAYWLLLLAAIGTLLVFVYEQKQGKKND